MRSLVLFLALAITPAARAQESESAPPARTGDAYHGAGGPFLGAIGIFAAGQPPLFVVSSGGYGYTYYGRFRLGGGGQGTLAAVAADGKTAELGWGTIHVGWDPLGFERFEFPVALSLGGGRLSVERTLDSGLVERVSAAFFALQASVSAEYLVFRTVKLTLMLSWVAGLNGSGLQFQAVEGSLRLVFMLPRPGH